MPVDVEVSEAGPARRVLLAATPDNRRQLIADAFRTSGWLVTETADGKAAWDSIRTERPELAIIQAILPRLDGIEVLQRLKADPLTQPIPVALLIGSPADVGSYPAVSAAGEVFESVADFIVIPSLLKDPAELYKLMGGVRGARAG